jgi:hypothetical protein
MPAPAPRRTKAELLSENESLREQLAAMTPPDYSLSKDREHLKRPGLIEESPAELLGQRPRNRAPGL